MKYHSESIQKVKFFPGRGKILRTLALAIILSLLGIAIPATPALAVASIDLYPDSGRVGDSITIIGTGFTTGHSLEVYVDDTPVAWPALILISFSDSFIVPNLAAGQHLVRVWDYDIGIDGAWAPGASASFTIIGAEITLDLEEGPVGTEVEIAGTDFGSNKDITVEYDGVEVDIESGDDGTTSSGEFVSFITIPESTAGVHTITVIDTSANEAEAEFTVEPEIVITPTSGAIGDEVAVSGTGFGYRKYVTIFFDDVEMTVTSGTDRTGSDGSFEDLMFNVPVVGSGTYDVEVEDTADNTDTKEFTIEYDATITPGTGNVGTGIIVSGTGFIPGGTVTIKYDGTSVTTATIGTDGAFSAPFNAPVSSSGAHTVNVSDGTNTKNLTFTMESTAPPIPQPLLPEMGAKAEATTHFDWGDVTDPSLPVTYTLQIASDAGFTTLVVPEKTGLTVSEYTLTEAEKLESTKKEAPYYWRVKAIDGASNESGWSGAGEFYVGFGWPNWATYTFLGIGALLLSLLGFWLGRRSAYYSY